MQQFGYDSKLGLLKLMNKSGAMFYLRRKSHSDGFGMIYIFDSKEELDGFRKHHEISLNDLELRLRDDWKVMFNDCALDYTDGGFELKGGFVQLFQSGDDFYVTLGIGG